MRRPRYAGRHPRAFHEKYKEHAPERYPTDVAKVVQAGKTPAGMHRPIMVDEILRALSPRPGDVAVDATLGYGGHARAIVSRLLPGGRLIGLDVDPIELPRTEARWRADGFGADVFTAHRTNFAGLPAVLAREGVAAVDLLLADLGVSSMQIDDPARGFTFKASGPLDMRMNPRRGESAQVLVRRLGVAELSALLVDFADEPYAEAVASRVAGRQVATTDNLAALVIGAIEAARPGLPAPNVDRSVRRVFQALRVAVNDELGALDTLLRLLPDAMAPGGRIAILTFHSGEDRRVKKAFAEGRRAGVYAEVSVDAERPSAEEVRANPRAAAAKLRWARRAPDAARNRR
jgi:16S rRNA (cytosine1402-N4)-methyltransferase